MLDTVSFIVQHPFSVLGGTVAAWLVGSAVYNLWLHPLRHVPGPWYAAISPMYIVVKDLQFVKAHVIHDMHKKYGNTIRISPNQVVFLDQQTLRTTFGAGSKFPKSTFYKALMTNEGDHAMTLLEPWRHAPRRRAFAPHYTPANLAMYQPEIHAFVNELIDKMAACKGERSFETLLLFRRPLVDILFVASYGQRFNAVKDWDAVTCGDVEGPAEKIITAIHLFPIRGVIIDLLPKWMWNLASKIPHPEWQALVDSDHCIAQYVIKAKDNIIAKDPMFKETGDLAAVNDFGDERISLIHRLLRHSLKAKDEDKLTEHDVVCESMAHTVAGVDTTATTLAFMFYVLTYRKDVLAKLRAELDPLMPDDLDTSQRKFPDIAILNKLPYFNAFVKESLRVHGAAPSLLERVVPSTLDGPFFVEGYEIPPGTILSTQSWSMQRVAEVFPEPDSFWPERWFDETEEMRAHLMPFGYGQRICGGMNMAQMTLRVLLAAIARYFDPVAPPETNPETMAARFSFVLLPAALKVPLIYKPRHI